MEKIYMILGFVIIYTTTHFMFIQNKDCWMHRTAYEKVVTVVAIVSIVLIYLGGMFE